ARLEAGAMPLQRRWRAVDEILLTALERAAPLTSRHQIHSIIAEDCPVVRVDAHALAEVLYTLIDNATKYAPPGTSIRVLAHRANDAQLLLAVEDEGRGIPVALREHVFEKFFRAVPDDAHSSTRPTGIGLGLAIARGIVEAHGGRIWIEDGPGGRGTRVALTIPIGDEAPAVAEHLAEPATESAVNAAALAPRHVRGPQ